LGELLGVGGCFVSGDLADSSGLGSDEKGVGTLEVVEQSVYELLGTLRWQNRKDAKAATGCDDVFRCPKDMFHQQLQAFRSILFIGKGVILEALRQRLCSGSAGRNATILDQLP